MSTVEGTKSWWSGDKRVEGWMAQVHIILDKEVESKESKKRIYNVIYETMHKAIHTCDGFTKNFKTTECHEATEFYLDRFLSEDEKFRLLIKGQRIGYHTNIKDLGAGTIISFLREVNKQEEKK
jgi:hypothetical protein